MNVAILITINESFLGPGEVAVRSFFASSPELKAAKLFVVSFGNNALGDIHQFFYGLNVEYLTIPSGMIPSQSPMPGHFSAENYIRLFAEEFIPHNYDRLVYFDADFFFPAELPNFENHLRSCAFISAVPNSGQLAPHSKDLPLVVDAPYFNSGFLIINLAAFRRRRVAELSRSCILEHGTRLKLVDQDVLNILFAREIESLPTAFNLQSSAFFEYYWYFWMRKKFKVRGALHFSTKYKPWLPKSHHPYTYLYRSSEFYRKSRTPVSSDIVENFKRVRNTFTALRCTFRRIPPLDLIESVYGRGFSDPPRDKL